MSTIPTIRSLSASFSEIIGHPTTLTTSVLVTTFVAPSTMTIEILPSLVVSSKPPPQLSPSPPPTLAPETTATAETEVTTLVSEGPHTTTTPEPTSVET